MNELDAITRTLGTHYVVLDDDIEGITIHGIFSTFEQAAYYLAEYTVSGCEIERWVGSMCETVLTWQEARRR